MKEVERGDVRREVEREDVMRGREGGGEREVERKRWREGSGEREMERGRWRCMERKDGDVRRWSGKS